MEKNMLEIRLRCYLAMLETYDQDDLNENEKVIINESMRIIHNIFETYCKSHKLIEKALNIVNYYDKNRK